MREMKHADEGSHKYSILKCFFLWYLLEHSKRMSALITVKETLASFSMEKYMYFIQVLCLTFLVRSWSRYMW